VVDGCETDGCDTDGCAVGAWVALGVAVPAWAGARADRMPGIDACAPGPPDPDGWVVDGWGADGWVSVARGAAVGVPGRCACGVTIALDVGVPAAAGARADRMPGIDACASDGSDPDGWPADDWPAVGSGAGA